MRGGKTREVERYLYLNVFGFGVELEELVVNAANDLVPSEKSARHEKSLFACEGLISGFEIQNGAKAPCKPSWHHLRPSFAGYARKK